MFIITRIQGEGLKGPSIRLSHTAWAASTGLIYLYINDKYLKGQDSEKQI